eukprot:s218_g22.t1
MQQLWSHGISHQQVTASPLKAHGTECGAALHLSVLNAPGNITPVPRSILPKCPKNLKMAEECVFDSEGSPLLSSSRQIGDKGKMLQRNQRGSFQGWVILLDVKSNEQRFFDGHTNDVLCLAWNENQSLCISGQMDVKGADGPKACIWSPDDVSSFCNLLHPGYSRSVSAVALSSDGQTAVTFTTDEAPWQLPAATTFGDLTFLAQLRTALPMLRLGYLLAPPAGSRIPSTYTSYIFFFGAIVSCLTHA